MVSITFVPGLNGIRSCYRFTDGVRSSNCISFFDLRNMCNTSYNMLHEYLPVLNGSLNVDSNHLNDSCKQVFQTELVSVAYDVVMHSCKDLETRNWLSDLDYKFKIGILFALSQLHIDLVGY